MADGTNVGNIYIDLVVRDTVEQQVQGIAAQGQKTAQKAFAGMEKAAERSANNSVSKILKLTNGIIKIGDAIANGPARALERALSGSLGKNLEKTFGSIAKLGDAIANDPAQAVEKAFSETQEKTEEALESLEESVEQCGDSVQEALTKPFNKSVAIAQAKLKALEEEFSQLSLRADEVKNKDTAFQIYGYVSDDNKEFWSLQKQMDKLCLRMAAARERLAIENQAAAQKQAAAEEKAAAQESKAAKKSAADQERAGKQKAAAEEKAANRRKSILASLWKNMLANAGNSAKKISSKITGLIKNFATVGKATNRFGARLREIASGALFFNGISRALRSLTQYMQEALMTSDEMKQALANLKGAAANAASPLIQVLTPALVKLANAAAVALTYVERLLTAITGKVSNAAETAAKTAQKNAQKAQRYLAGFDQLNRMDDKSGEDDDEDDEIEPNYGFKGFNSFLESILTAIQAGQWSQIGTLIAEKLNSTLASIPWDTILQKAKTWTQNFVDTLNGFIHNVNFGQIGVALGLGLLTLLTIIDTFFQGIDWVALGTGLATGLNDLIITVDWAMLGRVLTDKLKALFEIFHGFITTFDFATLGTNLAQMLNAAVDNINWEQLWQDIKLMLAKLFEGLCNFFAKLDPDILSAAINLLMIKAASAAFKTFAPIITDTLAKKLVEHLPTAFGTWMDELKTWATGTLQPKVIGWIKGTLVPKVTAALGSIASTLGISVGWVVAIGAAIAALVVLVVKNWDKIAEWTKKTWKKIQDIWEVAPEWFNEKIVEPIVSFFSDLWKKAQKAGEDAWIKMQQTWQNVSGWFNQYVVQPIRNAFSSVYTAVSDIWSSIVRFIKNAVNNVIASINGMISGIVSGINTVIRALNRLSFTVPSWLQYVPGAANIAGKTFGFNIATIAAPQIPYLADGGVIKQPTLAMVGEYSGARSDPEIVTPQSLMTETVSDVMEGIMGEILSNVVSGLGALLEEQRLTRRTVESIQIGDAVIGEAAARYAKSARMRSGHFTY